MAAVIPDISEQQLAALPSAAEAKMYQACANQLPSDTIVLFSVPWIRIGVHGSPRDGETDFVVCSPKFGLLVVEVKGGGIEVDSTRGHWYSVDRKGIRHEIKDPFRQASTEKYQLRDYLRTLPGWKHLSEQPTLGHAVMLPDVGDVTALVGADRPAGIIGNATSLENLEAWLRQVAAFWAGDATRVVGLGARGMQLVKDEFCRSQIVRPLLATALQEEERHRLRLTEEQGRLLRGLGRRNRAVISGGAGTGKTLLALDKALALARDGYNTLLVCYNRPLADHLKACTADTDNLTVASFHQLCDSSNRRARELTGRDFLREAELTNPGGNRYDVHMPHALALASEVLPTKFDAIIVDEAQDFGEEYWLPIEMLLQSEDESTLFLFLDHNQAVYNRVATVPIKQDVFYLTRNCRNTKPIHDAAYNYYQGEITDPPEIEGAPIESVHVKSFRDQARKLHGKIVELLVTEQVDAGLICVLVPSIGHNKYYEELRGLPLPKPVNWAFEGTGGSDLLRVETVLRFKGLEADIVLWWVGDDADAYDLATRYVTISRAKARLIIVGAEDACNGVQCGSCLSCEQGPTELP